MAQKCLLLCHFLLFLRAVKTKELTVYIDAVQKAVKAIDVFSTIAAGADEFTHLAMQPRKRT